MTFIENRFVKRNIHVLITALKQSHKERTLLHKETTADGHIRKKLYFLKDENHCNASHEK